MVLLFFGGVAFSANKFQNVSVATERRLPNAKLAASTIFIFHLVCLGKYQVAAVLRHKALSNQTF